MVLFLAVSVEIGNFQTGLYLILIHHVTYVPLRKFEGISDSVFLPIKHPSHWSLPELSEILDVMFGGYSPHIC